VITYEQSMQERNVINAAIAWHRANTFESRVRRAKRLREAVEALERAKKRKNSRTRT